MSEEDVELTVWNNVAPFLENLELFKSLVVCAEIEQANLGYEVGGQIELGRYTCSCPNSVGEIGMGGGSEGFLGLDNRSSGLSYLLRAVAAGASKAGRGC